MKYKISIEEGDRQITVQDNKAPGIDALLEDFFRALKKLYPLSTKRWLQTLIERALKESHWE